MYTMPSMPICGRFTQSVSSSTCFRVYPLQPGTAMASTVSALSKTPKPDAPVGTPSSGGYGLGWGMVSLPFSPEPFVFHGGSNNMNLAYIMLQPKKEIGIVAMTNIGGGKANDALMAITEFLYKRFGQEP